MSTAKYEYVFSDNLSSLSFHLCGVFVWCARFIVLNLAVRLGETWIAFPPRHVPYSTQERGAQSRRPLGARPRNSEGFHRQHRHRCHHQRHRDHRHRRFHRYLRHRRHAAITAIVSPWSDHHSTIIAVIATFAIIASSLESPSRPPLSGLTSRRGQLSKTWPD